MARKTLVLKVSPDIGNDPKVKLDDREPLAPGRVKVEWRKAAGSDDFDFIGFTPAVVALANGVLPKNPFKNISVKKTRIKCDFEPEQGEGGDPVAYAYTLAIEHDDVAYTTDKEEDPDFGKAVIRN
jgi:hypothetical protein